MSSLVAFTRPVPDSLAACELTHLSRMPIDVERARAEHAAYEAALASLGCDVCHLPATPDLPDSVFVEDAAVVLDEVAVITRPGAMSRQGETATVAPALAPHRDLRNIVEPGTLDGGDVLRLGRTLYVGLGARTNAAGAAQLAAIAGVFGYAVRTVDVSGCLHLKSAVTELAPGLVLVNRAWVQPGVFEGHAAIDADDGEPFAANVLRFGETILCAAAHERTNATLHAAGFSTFMIDVSELAKAEAGVTCCSLIVPRVA